MNINDAFPSNYLKAAELEEDTIVTIADVRMEEMGQGKDKNSKPVLYFEETDKGLVLNKTNSGTIAKLYGPETDDWIGKRITIYPTEVEFKGEQTLSIRIRLKAPTAKAAATKPAAGNAAAAKKAAWAKFVQQTPGSTAEQQEAFKTAVSEYFPDTEPQDITAEQWQQFADDEFQNLPV